MALVQVQYSQLQNNMNSWVQTKLGYRDKRTMHLKNLAAIL
jgi:hypothetical protein